MAPARAPKIHAVDLYFQRLRDLLDQYMVLNPKELEKKGEVFCEISRKRDGQILGWEIQDKEVHFRHGGYL